MRFMYKHFNRLKRSLSKRIEVVRFRYKVNRDWKQKVVGYKGQTHGFTGLLIINVTSFPPRFNQLHLTLKSLLLQSVCADKVVLWLYEKDIAFLPCSVLELKSHGLIIESCPDDIRSYKKLIPALTKWPDAYHVTADDDLYYPEDWLLQLVKGFHESAGADVICLRAHLMKYDQGVLLPYYMWEKETLENGPRVDLFPTTGAGALFSPGSLGDRVDQQDIFMMLAPYADDVWFYFMALSNHSKIYRVGTNRKLIQWESSKVSSLWERNKDAFEGNDQQISAVSKWLKL